MREENTKRLTLILTKKQYTLLDDLKEVLGVSNHSDVLRKALAFVLMFKEIRDKGQSFAIVNSDGSVAEKIRIL